MKLFLVFGAAALLWSCQSKSTSASAPDKPSERNATKASPQDKRSEVIVLDEIEQQKAHILVQAVRGKSVAVVLTVPGRLTVSDDHTWHVGAVAAGRIDETSAQLGDFVRAGQVLGRIHSHDVHEARAGYRQASVEMERARSAAEGYAKLRRDRAARLFELKAGSRQDVEGAEVELRNTQAAIEKAQSELEKERAHLTFILRVPLDETAGNDSVHAADDDIPILAPASGVILARKATVGSVVNAGDELFAITDMSNLWMIAGANEADLPELRTGQPVRIQVRAYPEREFAGRILKVGEQLDSATHTLQVRILVPNAQDLLKPEMYGTASVRAPGRRSAVFVPEEAVQDLDGLSVVFVRRAPDEFEARAVKAGQNLDGETEILEGLAPAESVVVKGSFVLKSQLLNNAMKGN